MANPHQKDARKSHGDKLAKLAGKRGEYPPDRAERIAHQGKSQPHRGDAAAPPEEVFTGAPSRQISNTGKVRK